MWLSGPATHYQCSFAGALRTLQQIPVADPGSNPGPILLCTKQYAADVYQSEVKARAAKCPKGPGIVYLCNDGSAAGGCSTNGRQFPKSTCQNQCQVVWTEILLSLSFVIDRQEWQCMMYNMWSEFIRKVLMWRFYRHWHFLEKLENCNWARDRQLQEDSDSQWSVHRTVNTCCSL